MFKGVVKSILNCILTLSLTLLIGGCGKKEEAKAPPPAPIAEVKAPQITPPAQPPQPAPTQAPQVATPTSAPAPAPAAAPAAPASKALATAEGEYPGVRVEVQELKRSGGTMMLRFAMVNESEKSISFHNAFSSDSDPRTVAGAHLVDPVGKKKYLIIRDSEKNCICSSGVADLQPKSSVNLWARFPEPPGDVQKISVVIPHFIPMDDVPISR